MKEGESFANWQNNYDMKFAQRKLQLLAWLRYLMVTEVSLGLPSQDLISHTPMEIAISNLRFQLPVRNITKATSAFLIQEKSIPLTVFVHCLIILLYICIVA